MCKKIAKSFCKREECPTATTLLLFNQSELARENARCVSEHLTECEFCATEFYLLASHPPQAEAIETNPAMPLALRDLAEALLGSRQAGFRLLNNLLGEKEMATIKN